MTVWFYNYFSKRNNSTKQPGATDTYDSKTCTLKEPTSIHDPVIQIDPGSSGTIKRYPYAYISEFGHYYFVVDIVVIHNRLVEYHLREDVLASYKAAIGQRTARIAFSSSNWDPYLPDTRAYVSNDVTQWTSQSAAPVFNGGSYIITVYCKDFTSYTTGFAVAYELTGAGMSKVRQWFGSNNIISALINYFNGNPLDSVFGCIWVPYTIPGPNGTNPLKTSTQKFWIGDINNVDTVPSFPFDNNNDCYIIHGMPVWNFDTTIQITNGNLDFRDFEPYSMAQMYFPGAGVVDISLKDLGQLTSANPLTVTVNIEIMTGNVRYDVRSVSGAKIQTINCNVAAQCPLGQTTTNGGNILSSLASTAVGVAGLAAAPATGGSSAIATAGVIAGAAGLAMSTMKHSPTIVGSSGGRLASLDPYIRLNMFHAQTEDVDDLNYIALRGRPCGKMLQISTLSGYVQCEGASLAIGGSDQEREEINNYMNTGFYWE